MPKVNFKTRVETRRAPHKPEESTTVSKSGFHDVILDASHIDEDTNPRLIEHVEYSHHL